MIVQEYYILIGILTLAVGTYLIRYSGFFLANRMVFKEQHRQMLSDSACMLLFTLAVFSTLFSEGHFSGVSKVIGVLTALIFAWKKYSLVVVIFVAVTLTSALRALGIK